MCASLLRLGSIWCPIGRLCQLGAWFGVVFVISVGQSLSGAPPLGEEDTLLIAIDQQFMKSDEVVLYRRTAMDVYLHPGAPHVPRRYPKVDVLLFGNDRGWYLSGVPFEVRAGRVFANYTHNGTRPSISLSKAISRLEKLSKLRGFAPLHFALPAKEK